LAAIRPLVVLGVAGLLVPEWVYPMYFVGWCVCAIFLMPLTHKVFRILPVRHKDKWVLMGRPTMFLNNSIGNQIAFIKFIMKGTFEALGDQELSNLCRKIRVWGGVFLSFTATMFPVLVISIHLHTK